MLRGGYVEKYLPNMGRINDTALQELCTPSRRQAPARVEQGTLQRLVLQVQSYGEESRGRVHLEEWQEGGEA